jgi:hypothetical protein
MEDDDASEKIRRFLKANRYVISKRDITQILNQMAQALNLPPEADIDPIISK